MVVDVLEPATGLEPVNLFLTKEALYLLSYAGVDLQNRMVVALERETGLEPATTSLEG